MNFDNTLKLTADAMDAAWIEKDMPERPCAWHGYDKPGKCDLCAGTYTAPVLT